MRLVGCVRDLAEHVPLDLPHVVLEALDDGFVRADDVEQRGLEDGPRPVAEHVGIGLQLGPHAGQRGGVPVAHGHQVVASGEQEQFAELDLLPLVDVAGGGDDRQQAVVVALDLRAVVLLAGVVDGQLGQVEGVADRVELGLARHPQAEPAEPGAAPLGGQLLDGVRLQRAPSLDVPGGVDDHRAHRDTSHGAPAAPRLTYGAAPHGADGAGDGPPYDPRHGPARARRARHCCRRGSWTSSWRAW